MSNYIKNWFSNMEPMDEPLIDQDGISYPTVEHYYQSYKYTSIEIRKIIAVMKSPFEAKAFAKKYKHKVRADWDTIKLDIMETALRWKFKEGTSWHKRLMDTGSEEIVENNNWSDFYWGVCNGKGENHLGKLLMKIRDESKPPLQIAHKLLHEYFKTATPEEIQEDFGDLMNPTCYTESIINRNSQGDINSIDTFLFKIK